MFQCGIFLFFIFIMDYYSCAFKYLKKTAGFITYFNKKRRKDIPIDMRGFMKYFCTKKEPHCTTPFCTSFLFSTVQALHALLAKQQLGSRKLIEQVFSPFRAVFRLVISIAGNAYCVNRKAVVSLHRLTEAELRRWVRLSGQLLFRNRLTGVLELRKRVRP